MLPPFYGDFGAALACLTVHEAGGGPLVRRRGADDESWVARRRGV